MNDKTNAAPITIELRGLSISYGGTLAVNNCSFSLARGETLGLVGESGSGKSSALMAIPRLLPRIARVSGDILCVSSGESVNLTNLPENELNKWRWEKIAIVPQGAMNSFTPHLTIERHITEVLEYHTNMSKAERKARAARLLGAAELDAAILPRYPHELSGGQKQRAAMALALSCDPDFLLADEPTTALDVITQRNVLNMITSVVRDRGMGLLFVTHDLPLAAEICDTIAVMKEGEIVESGAARAVIGSPSHDYTKRLIDAIRKTEEGYPNAG
ncbi:dipeptide/oligopeptide/nickel ABC transporter ATP-binding protein [Synergistales bacterium]|nr:dipeptide/oligopeptide/nickel ABC transporter ATP-binding protein [Synergistales bacterium]